MRDKVEMHTYKLAKDTDLLNLKRGCFGISPQEPALSGYIRLPLRAGESNVQRASWRLLLELTGTAHGWLAFEIVDDVIVGRGSEGPGAPDLDMAILKAGELGVSRQHALLRPSARNLYLIDLGSTNGTFVNSVPLCESRAHPLAESDHLSLGKLNMRIAHLEAIPGAQPGPKTDDLPAPPAKVSTETSGPPTQPLKD